MLNAADLPNDIDALKALLMASERRVQERDDQLAGLTAQLNTRGRQVLAQGLQRAEEPRLGRRPDCRGRRAARLPGSD
jgi:hypothetical protein